MLSQAGNCILPPISTVFKELRIIAPEMVELRNELTTNKESLLKMIDEMKLITQRYEYDSIVEMEKYCRKISEFGKVIRVQMIKHDSRDLQKDSHSLYFDQVIPPVWFEFKRDGPKYCVHCECVDTIEWRNGPWGKSTLCNACGLWYRKLKRKYDIEQCAILMEERRVFSDTYDRKEISEFNLDEDVLRIVKSSVVRRLNEFLKEVELCNSTKVRISTNKNIQQYQKVTPLEINKYDSISRIC